MAEFNIQNSKIEQVSDSGNNFKVSGGQVATSDQGNIVQTAGAKNKVHVGSESFLALLWKKLVTFWRWLTG